MVWDGSLTVGQEHHTPEEAVKLAEARKTNQTLREGGPPPPASMGGMGLGFRLATDLVSALLVGGVIGWLLDRAFGSEPWLFVVFIIVGFAAGFRNIMRTFNEAAMAEKSIAPVEKTKDR